MRINYELYFEVEIVIPSLIIFIILLRSGRNLNYSEIWKKIFCLERDKKDSSSIQIPNFQRVFCVDSPEN